VTSGAAIAVVVTALVGGFLLQRVALSEPGGPTFTAVRVGDWFGRYRLVDSTISVDGRPSVHGRCLQDWFAVDGSRRRGAVLRLDDGLVVLDIPPHTLVARGGTAADRAVPPLVLLELAGCPRFLERRIETLAQQRADLGGSQDVLRFTLKGTRVSMALDPASSLPMGVTVASRSARGTSEIRFRRLTPQIRRRFRAGNLGTS